jgi:hypothetical protein
VEVVPLLLFFFIVFWVAAHVRVQPPPTRMRKAVSRVPKGVATRNPKGYSVRVPSKVVPIYRRTPALRARARELAESVRLGELAIKTHDGSKRCREADGTHASWCTIDAIRAGVARDRKTLRKLEYDQPI